jgi:hypothetical protein
MSDTVKPYTGPSVTMPATYGPPNAAAMQAGNANTAQANALGGLAGGTLKTRRRRRQSAYKKSRNRKNKSNHKNKSNRKTNNKKKKKSAKRKSSRKRVKMVGGVGEPIPYNSPRVPYNGGSEIGDISKTLAIAHASSSSQAAGDHKV